MLGFGRGRRNTDDAMIALSNEQVAKLQKRFRKRIKARAVEVLKHGEKDKRLEAMTGLLARAARARTPLSDTRLHELSGASPAYILQEARRLEPHVSRRELRKHISIAKGNKRDWEPPAEGLFGTTQRVYFRLPKSGNVEMKTRIEKYLEDKGYQDISYATGTAAKPGEDPKSFTTILEDKRKLLRGWQADTDKAEAGQMIVFCRHPYDMDRRPLSADSRPRRADGKKVDEMDRLREGSITAYLVDENDPEMYKPRARIDIQPYKSRRGDVLMVQGRTRGTAPESFGETVGKVVEKYINDGVEGRFVKSELLEHEGMESSMLRSPLGFSPSTRELLDFVGVRYFEVMGNIIVPGDLDLSNMRLAGLPDMSRVHVRGSFSVANNELESLDGAPGRVNGDFDCSQNRLDTLEGAPENVGGSFIANGNALTSLQHVPGNIGKDIDFSNNMLTSIAGLQTRVRGSLKLTNNKLNSLAGAPTRIDRDLEIDGNEIRSLISGPERVGGRFDCRNNPLNDLVGLPTRAGPIQTPMGDWKRYRQVPKAYTTAGADGQRPAANADADKGKSWLPNVGGWFGRGNKK
ncbi:MAG: hypothetical protein Alpg2KO_24600 [Alphaproteobacteria bacterium]